jgi:hypothetical protein
MAGLERILWYLNFLATLGLLARLWQCRLTRTHRSLFWYWVAQAAETPILLQVPLNSVLYNQLYYALQTVSLFLAVWVVLELYREALAGHPVFARFGRQSVLGLMVTAALLAAMGVLLDSRNPRGMALLVHRYLEIERTAGLMICAFLLLISGFLLWFPVKVKRNVVVYIVGFVCFYSFRSVGLLFVNLLPPPALRPVSVLLLGCSLACLLFWTVGLRKESEDVVTVTGSRSHSGALDRLSAQLDQINRALSRSARDTWRLRMKVD